MLLLLLSSLLACTGSKAEDTGGGDTGGGDTAPAGPGTLSFTFEMDEDYFEQMDEPAVGSFLGSVYAEADASSIGPNDGASPLFDVHVDGVDLTDGGGPTGVMYTSEPLDAQIVWVLGCLDTDANDCEHNDPITVPNENKVQVVGGTDTEFNVYFGMLDPQ